MRGPLLLAAIALPLLATRSDPLAGRVAGAPVDCIDLNRVQGPDIVDAQTILYRQTSGRIWRATPEGQCVALRPLATLIVEPFGPQLCRNDRFRVLETGAIIPSAYCRFARFTPYDKP